MMRCAILALFFCCSRSACTGGLGSGCGLVKFDTLQRFHATDYRVRGVDVPFMVTKLGLKAEKDQALGGMRYGLMPNPTDAALSAIFSRRSSLDWGKFCKSRTVTDSWGSWTQGVAYCH